MRTRYRELRALGLPENVAGFMANTRKGSWRSSQSPPLQQALSGNDTDCCPALDEPLDAEGVMPKPWNETIEAYRREVRDAILDTPAALLAEHGLQSVTMSQIAFETGIGPATLYEYFSGVEAIPVTWNERQLTRHFQHLVEVRDQAGEAGERLEAVLNAYALISYEYHGTELAPLVHRGEHVARAQQLSDVIRDLLTAAARGATSATMSRPTFSNISFSMSSTPFRFR